MTDSSDLMHPKNLSWKIKVVWALDALPFLFLAVILLSAFFYLIVPYFVGVQFSDLYNALFLLSVLVVFSLFFVYLELKYRHYMYVLHKKHLEISRGIIEKTKIIVPYDRIQDIKTSKALSERILGIGTICIETAGITLAEEIKLPGIDEPEALAQELVERSRQRKKQEAARHQEAHDAIIVTMKEMEEILLRIESAIKKLSRELSTSKSGKKRKRKKE